MDITPKGQIIKGYKATNHDLTCNGYQFTVGEWHECEGELELCQNGFHFCEYPSGPWAHYSDGRLWECEADEVVLSSGPGADLKHVARRMRLIREIQVNGNGNTGNRNTGDLNTGNGNTGNGNTGNRNNGDGNTGDWNTGNRNTGDLNAGDWNTGNWNTGNRNTGNRNTGDLNTGNRNTGDLNTGNWNTGYGNVGDRHTGSLCMQPEPIKLFDHIVDDETAIDWSIVCDVASAMTSDELIQEKAIPDEWLTLPHATKDRIIELHKAHIEARKALKEV